MGYDYSNDAFTAEHSHRADPPRAGARGDQLWAEAPRARRGRLNHLAGLAAEDGAARAYRARGAAVLARRRRYPEGELDLVVREGDVLVFAEVKRRSGAVDADPVGPRQWRRLEAAAQRYMVEAQTGDRPCRFDLVLVGRDGAVEVIDNARC